MMIADGDGVTDQQQAAGEREKPSLVWPLAR